MNYQETLDYLFQQLPMFQRVGKQAFKKDLTNITKLCTHLGNPQEQFRSVHLAGTNGKGSTAHIIAAVLQTAGYKVGLYSSPHYKDFRERIKINAAYISEQAVIDFVAKNSPFFEQLQPSFFEITVAMAFQYFAEEQVDIAIIETGLGGRLDSTNIITPLLSVITNIGFDHEAMLGNTLALIAGEKAGIIKPTIPVIIGENHPETRPVFEQKAQANQAAIYFAEEQVQIKVLDRQLRQAVYQLDSSSYPSLQQAELHSDLTGNYQTYNLRTALLAVVLLRKLGFPSTTAQLLTACQNIQSISGLLGRWQVLAEQPLTICDSGHNGHGLKYLKEALHALPIQHLRIVLGVVRDKDLNKLFPYLPTEATYYFCQANIPRALPALELQQAAHQAGFQGKAWGSVANAYQAAQTAAQTNDCIFIGGSIFVVAEVL